MYNLLVVDDEKYAVHGVTRGIDWTDLPIGGIFEAMDVEEAMAAFAAQRIDLLISDIEMPGLNGLELQRWVLEHSPHTETIFLTGHANFAYAQQAIQLGGFDYVLKPVDHDQLKEVAAKALQKLARERELLEFQEAYRTYSAHWQSQLPMLVERFWQDLLGGRVPLAPERLQRLFRLYDMPLAPDSAVVPVLISVEEWQEELSARDEDIMEYALRKAAAELVLDDWPGCVVSERSGYSLALVYAPAGEAELRSRCLRFVADCRRYFRCRLSCYIGPTGMPAALAETVADLLAMERGNVGRTNEVHHLREYAAAEGDPPSAPAAADWTPLLEAGKKAELLVRLNAALDRMQTTGVRAETLEAFYYALHHAASQLALKKGLSARDMIPAELHDFPAATRSLSQLRSWAQRFAAAAADAIGGSGKDVSAVIARTMQLIRERLHTNVSREQIAAEVYLNPAYLSRLFKKETGLSLSDYMLVQRMELAKRLLKESNLKISGIAEAVGYDHFSHFAKMFKRVAGVSPHDYRKTYRDV
ncbi:MAG: response regulator [Paenibacillaceae bacterium]|nr:response regulator [Paenibacillaceae bacterium]